MEILKSLLKSLLIGTVIAGAVVIYTLWDRSNYADDWSRGQGRPPATMVAAGNKVTAPASIKDTNDAWYFCTADCRSDAVRRHPTVHYITAGKLGKDCYVLTPSNRVPQIWVATKQGRASYTVEFTGDSSQILICLRGAVPVSGSLNRDFIIVWSDQSDVD